MILTRKLALGVAGVVAAGVLGTAGVAAATSETSAPTPAASSAPAGSTPAGKPATTDKKAGKKAGKHRARAVLARGMHGEWVVKGKDGKPVTLVSIRGQVTAAGPTSVTVKAEDGFTATFTTTADTKVRGGATTMADVKVGATGAVVGVKSGNTTTARTVLVRK
jgi:hypothetical protein